MKDMAMEVILALGSGIVLAMFGIGVPDPKEAEKMAYMFSEQVQDALGNTMQHITGEHPLAPKFVHIQTELLAVVQNLTSVTQAQKDVAGMIVERCTRDTMEKANGSFDKAMIDTTNNGASKFMGQMETLVDALKQHSDDRAQIMDALKKFETNQQHKRTLSSPEEPLATFANPGSITKSNVDRDAAEGLKGSLTNSQTQAPPTNPKVQPFKRARHGQVPVTEQKEKDIKSSWRPDAPPITEVDNKTTLVLQLQRSETDQLDAPYMAIRKLKTRYDVRSGWVNAEDGEDVIALHAPVDTDGIQMGKHSKIYQFLIPEDIPAQEWTAGFFVGVTSSDALAMEQWDPFYEAPLHAGHQPKFFYLSDISSAVSKKLDFS